MARVRSLAVVAWLLVVGMLPSAATPLVFNYDETPIASRSAVGVMPSPGDGPDVRSETDGYDYDDFPLHLARTNALSPSGFFAPQTARAASNVADDIPRHSPSFIAHPNGEIAVVPQGAVGPTPVRSGKGFQFTGGSGGHGLDPRVTDIRIMDPVVGGKYPYPNGYVSYSNRLGQPVNPYTGRTLSPDDTWWHWSWS